MYTTADIMRPNYHSIIGQLAPNYSWNIDFQACLQAVLETRHPDEYFATPNRPALWNKVYL